MNCLYPGCPSDQPKNSIILAPLLLDALILDSGRLRSDFPALNKDDLKVEEVLALYDSYLTRCNVIPSLSMQNILSPKACVLNSPDTLPQSRIAHIHAHAEKYTA